MTRRPPRSPLFPSTPLFRSPDRNELLHAILRLLLQESHRIGAGGGGVPASVAGARNLRASRLAPSGTLLGREVNQDRKSTRLNSSHSPISYAVFCLEKTKQH